MQFGKIQVIAGSAVALLALAIAQVRAQDPEMEPITGEARPANEAPKQAAQVVIEIPGTSCANCTPAVRRALQSAGGVTALEEGSPKNRIVVTFAPGPSRPAVYAEALRKVGFEGARLTGD